MNKAAAVNPLSHLVRPGSRPGREERPGRGKLRRRRVLLRGPGPGDQHQRRAGDGVVTPPPAPPLALGAEGASGLARNMASSMSHIVPEASSAGCTCACGYCAGGWV